MAFNLAKLKASVAELKESQSQGGGGDWPLTVFLPNGLHRGRLVVDPLGELFCQYMSYGYFNKGIRDPDSLPAEKLSEGFKNELAELVEKEFKPRGLWKFNRKPVFLVWFYLTQTDSPSEDWEVGKLYCIIGNNRLRDAVTSFLSSMAEEAPDDIMSILDPNETGLQVNIENQGGAQGKCSIAVTYPTKKIPPLDLTQHVYVPLQEAYIKPGFNQEKYNALVAKYKEEVTKLKPISEYQTEEDKEEAKESPKETTPEVPEPVSQQASQDEPPFDVDEKPAAEKEDPFAKYRTNK